MYTARTPCSHVAIILAILTALTSILLLTLAGCTESSAKSARLRIVSTTGMIHDLVRQIAGDRADSTGLMGEGVDPHLYKATPGDIRRLSDADIVFYNGLHLEGRLGDVLSKLSEKKPVVAVGEAIDSSLLRHPAEFEGHPDPHVWFDVSLWSHAAESIRDTLIKADPPGREAYTASAEKLLKELAELHEWCKIQIATIPETRRVLITAHDAFGYFGSAYGIQVRGIQGISTDSEASLRDIASLVDTLVSGNVPAVFIESSVPRKTIEALVEGCRSRGHTVVIGGELYSDAMGKDGTEGGTYIGMIRHNVTIIVRALKPGEPASNAPASQPAAEPGQ
jgi:manganese/zinc/iron transport system substrate-binding protein